MILLEKGNRILEETVKAILINEGKTAPSCVNLCDFDDVSYRVSVDKDKLTHMKVQMSAPVYTEIEEEGGKAALAQHFPGMEVEEESGMSCAIEVDLTPERTEAEIDELVTRLSCFKGLVLGGLFHHYLDPLADGGEPRAPKKYDLRSDTAIYFIPKTDRVTIVMSVGFSEDVDKILGKVFLELFMKNKGAGVPPCRFSVEPPQELQSEPFNETENDGSIGYISFAILPRHVGKQTKQVIHCLLTFRSFLQYHIKMSKSYFHSRMRARCQSLLKILNRAKAEDPMTKKSVKTASGKTFKR